MTMMFYPISGHYGAVAEGFALPEPDVAVMGGMGYAAIPLGLFGTAQGPVLRRWRDGRVSIDAGGQVVSGYPAGSQPRGWWSRISGRAGKIRG
ncbi:MAG: hypothetical protein Q4G25_13010 [Paracoccus sp. (in: a-proteobacteria)]|nr:hypothetical protein [Paracoccus sp. (in: a-proteobacteria)]